VIEAFEAQQNEKISLPSTLKKEFRLVPEVYVYDEPYLRDHTVYGKQVLIGVTHGSLAINAFFTMFPQEAGVHLHQLTFVKPIEVKKGERVEVVVEPVQNDSTIDFRVMSRETSSTKWELTASGNFQKTRFDNQDRDIEHIKESFEEFPHIHQIYTGNPGVGLGDSFKTITQLHTGQDQALARVVLQQSSREEQHKYVLHPLIIHSAFAAIGPVLGQSDNEDTFFPFGVKDIRFLRTGGLDRCWVLVRLVKNSGEMIVFDADVITDESQVVAHFSGCSLKRFRFSDRIPAKTPQQIRETSTLESGETSTHTSDLSYKIQKYLVNKLGKIINERSRLSDIEVNLMELGVESSQLMDLANEIEQEAHIELSPAVFFEYPNIKELTEFFSQDYQDSFMQILGIVPKQSGFSDNTRQAVESIPPKTEQEIIQPRRTVLQSSASSDAHVSLGSITDDIAVIGISGRFPMARDLHEFWSNLVHGKDCICEIPKDRWNWREYYGDPAMSLILSSLEFRLEKPRSWIRGNVC
jgi:acyl transferase domain-containing protein